MRRLRIEHVTGFAYQGAAGASYNEARMLPRSGDHQLVLFTELSVDPSSSVNYYTDYFGSLVAVFDVLTPHAELSISARSLVEVRTRSAAPSGIDWAGLRSGSARSIATAEMIPHTARATPHGEAAELARELAGRAKSPADAARTILEAVHESMEYVPGTTGVHSSGSDAWQQRKGVCQDFAHVSLGALREAGIPTRYVSGYLQPREDAEIGERVQGESHAWVEWWAGEWRGYDPTNGCEIGDRHVSVGRGRDYTDVPPLRGVYDGPRGSTLHVSVSITREA